MTASLRPGSPLRLVVHGAAGRMGQRVIACAASDTTPWQLVAAIERIGHPRLGADAAVLAGLAPAGVAVGDAWQCPADVAIDFSLPEAVAGFAAACANSRLPLVVATTGLGPREILALEAAAKTIPVLQSPSMSLAVNVAMDLVARAGTLLGRSGVRSDVEIVECHHRHKEDSPSGTALKFGSIVREVLGHGRPTRSATTLSVPATTRASTQSCSAWMGNRSPSTCGPPTAIAMRVGRWPLRHFWWASLPDSTRCAMFWDCEWRPPAPPATSRPPAAPESPPAPAAVGQRWHTLPQTRHFQANSEQPPRRQWMQILSGGSRSGTREIESR